MKKLIKKAWCLLKKAWSYKPREIIPHHDSRPNSYYQTSQRALRDKRSDYLEGRL